MIAPEVAVTELEEDKILDFETETVFVLPGAEKFNETLLLAVLKEGSEAFPNGICAEVVGTVDTVAAVGFALKFSVGAVVAEGAIFGVNENPVFVEEKLLNPEGCELGAL